MDNSPENTFADLQFCLLQLYSTVLEFAVFVSDLSTDHRRAMVTGFIPMKDPTQAIGVTGKLFRAARDLEKAGKACEQTATVDLNAEMRSLLNDTPLVFEEVEDTNTGVLYENEEYQSARLRGICSLPYMTHFKNLQNSRVSGTCAWLLQQQEFTLWRGDEQNSLFWLRGSCQYCHIP